ncbi:heterokaryon incompatibility protein-domain-containing protein [Cercophora newfieldiana]|uniref:Heterokaryon incompatibility protein-domain-containing protein n=1 Tax=Cercophora newfieldiana TaxID=92897 RepID=A0AA39YMF1_9PEZI|nr:heterokaryon incompatibility protein-domain-containing protein [Cercophora newfieldiana]
MDGTLLANESHSIYHELPLQYPSHVRILRLAAGEPADPLSGSILVDDLGGVSPPIYEALSYVWGAPNRTHTLECNGRKVLITETLDKALRRLRRQDRDRRLWIDQICIDQGNLEERTHQVYIMKQIYQRANKVISWLGPDVSHQAPLASELIERILHLKDIYQKHPKTVHFPTNRQLKKLGLPSRGSPSWGALEALLQHQYFERVWVLQEVRMGCKVRLSWGDTTIPWGSLSGVYTFATKFWMQIADPQASMKPCPTLSLERLEAFMMRSTTWVDLLRATRRFGATDLRDKIFALVGLAGEESVLTSDYAATIGEVYAGATKHIIRTSGDLRILAYVWIRDLDALEGVPTWAPRWDDIADVNTTPKVLADWASYSASGPEKVRLRDDSQWDVLTLEGIAVDEVDCLAPPLDSWDNLERTWWKIVAESLRVADPVGRLQKTSPEDLMLPFLWTITAGQSLGLNGLTCLATEPQHIEDFVAFAFNGLMQTLSSEDDPVCLREILNLVDCALRSLPQTPVAVGYERVYDEPEVDEKTDGGSSQSQQPGSAQFDDEQDENEPPLYKVDHESALDWDDQLDGEELGTSILGEGIFDIYDESDGGEGSRIDENPFTLLPGRPHDDGDEERRPNELDKSAEDGPETQLGRGKEIREDFLPGGKHGEPGDRESRGISVMRSTAEEGGDGRAENRHPLGVLQHDRARSRLNDGQSHTPPMSRQWIENTLRSFHPSDPAAVDAALDIIERAHDRHDTAAVIRFMSQFEVSSVNRRFFVTKKGYMGIGPAYMQEGDIVCVLFGGPTPYALRPTSKEGKYLFLGECYVDDVMNGEALALLGKGRRETQWFSLR